MVLSKEMNLVEKQLQMIAWCFLQVSTERMNTALSYSPCICHKAKAKTVLGHGTLRSLPVPSKLNESRADRVDYVMRIWALEKAH